MTGWHMPRLLEAAIAAAIATALVELLAWRIDADLVIAPAMAFLVVFLATLWRSRTSTINHRAPTRRTRTGTNN